MIYCICIVGVCLCDVGFGGADCSVDINLPPVVDPDIGNIHITCQGACTTVTIIGSGFIFSNELICRFNAVTVCYVHLFC